MLSQGSSLLVTSYFSKNFDKNCHYECCETYQNALAPHNFANSKRSSQPLKAEADKRSRSKPIPAVLRMSVVSSATPMRGVDAHGRRPPFQYNTRSSLSRAILSGA